MFDIVNKTRDWGPNPCCPICHTPIYAVAVTDGANGLGRDVFMVCGHTLLTALDATDADILSMICKRFQTGNNRLVNEVQA